MPRPPGRKPPFASKRSGTGRTQTGSNAGHDSGPSRRSASNSSKAGSGGSNEKSDTGTPRASKPAGWARAKPKPAFRKSSARAAKSSAKATEESVGQRKAPPSIARAGAAKPARPTKTSGERPSRPGDHRPRRGRPATPEVEQAPHIDRKRGTQTRKPTVSRAPTIADPNAIGEPMRIAKAIAKAGLCSRRDAEVWIAEGRVKLNGKTLDTPAIVVTPGDLVLVDGEPLPAHAPPELWRYHKPKGRVTTHRDPEGRPTVFDAMPEDMPRVISIGRLDFNTEGLLLMTNDGDLARHLELPATGWLRRYRVRAHGDVKPDALSALADGVTIDGVSYGPIDAKIDSKQGGNTWMSVALREGKNREVRNIMANLGLVVNRLIRVSYGPFQLQDLAVGQVEHVRRKVLADQLGPSLAEKFGLRDADPAAARKVEYRKRNKPTA